MYGETITTIKAIPKPIEAVFLSFFNYLILFYAYGKIT